MIKHNGSCLISKLCVGIVVYFIILLCAFIPVKAEDVFLGKDTGSSGTGRISEHSSRTATFYNCAQIGDTKYNLQVTAYCSDLASYCDAYIANSCDTTGESNTPTVYIEYDADDFDAHNDDYDDEYSDCCGTIKLTLKVVNSSGTAVHWAGYFGMNDLDSDESWSVPFQSILRQGRNVSGGGTYFYGRHSNNSTNDKEYAVIGWLDIPTSGTTLTYNVDVEGGSSPPSGRASTFALSVPNNLMSILKVYPNGGKYNGTNAVTLYQRLRGTSLALPNPTWPTPEYVFNGWSKTGNSWSGNTFNFNSDGTATATWRLNTFDVKFNANGGSPTPATQTILYGNKATKPSNPTRTGYRFAQWYSGSSLFDFNTAIKQAYTLTAHWDANHYYVNYNKAQKTTGSNAISLKTIDSTGTEVASSISGSMAKSEHIYDTAKKLNKNTYTLPGYKFYGWTQTSGTATSASRQYKDEESVKNLTATHLANIQMYTIWEPLGFTLTFNGNKPSNATYTPQFSPTSKAVTFDAKIGAVPTPTLIGWTLNKASNGDMWYIGPKTHTINANFYYRYTTSQTAYAYDWTANKYKIYYDKGKTSDVTETNVVGATRATNLQSTGTDRPYTDATYDSDVTMASLPNTIKGTAYTIEYYPNFPDSDSKGGAATEAIKKTYQVTPKTSTDAKEKATQNWTETSSNDINSKWTLTGNLINAGTWTVSGCDTYCKLTNKTVQQGVAITKPNFIATDGGSVLATANWLTTVVNTESYETPQMKGYIFLGWYDGADYTIQPDGKGGFTHNTTANKITSITFAESTTAYNKQLYAHWMPIMGYFNHSYVEDDTKKGNYLAYENEPNLVGHLVNDLNNGYLTKDIHIGTKFWEYAGRDEASVFYGNEKEANSAEFNYVKIGSVPNPAIYFNVDLYPRTRAITYENNTITNVGLTGNNLQVYMPKKFLDTVYDFNNVNNATGEYDASKGKGTRDTLVTASLASNTWTKANGAGITYGGNIAKQADNNGLNYKYRIYDVWTLKGWSLSNKDETVRSDSLITNDTIVDNYAPAHDLNTRYDFAAHWNKDRTSMRLPKPKRVYVFNFDKEGDSSVVFRYESQGSSATTNAILKNIDDTAHPEQIPLRKLVEGQAVEYTDTDTLPNIYQGNTIIANADNSLVYDMNFEGWVNEDGVTTQQPLETIYTDKDTSYYAKWSLTNTDFELPQVDKEGYVFLGWYTIPQHLLPMGGNNKNMNTKELAYYYAGAGYDMIDGKPVARDCHLQYNTCHFDWNNASNMQTLYAWFNRIPVFVDIYDGVFFEGQDVSMYDLKKLVGVFDYEDDYSKLALQFIENLPEVTTDQLYVPIIVDTKPIGPDTYDVDKEYGEHDIVETLQVDSLEFDASKWKPVNSLDMVVYDELPTEEEQNNAYTPSDTKITISNGLLYTPRHPEGIDGVYKSKENNKTYYTAEAKAELAYYIQCVDTVSEGSGETTSGYSVDNQDDFGDIKHNYTTVDGLDYTKFTGLKLKVKSITYHVVNGTSTDEKVAVNVNLGGDSVASAKAYDNTLAAYTTVPEYTRYDENGNLLNGKIREFRSTPIQQADLSWKSKTYRRKLSNYRLDTSSSRLIFSTDANGNTVEEGTFDVTYEVTDDGILFNNIKLDKTAVKLTYTRKNCKIKYNNLPQIALSNLIDFTDTTYADYESFEKLILDAQTIIDAEDNLTNMPWWMNKNTTPRLLNSVEIVKVSGITTDRTLLEKYGLTETDAAELESVHSLRYLYEHYKTAAEGTKEAKLWKCISSINVVVDAHDQWGKYASGKVVPNYHKKSDGGDGGDKIGGDDEGVYVNEVVDTDNPDKPLQPDDYRTITIIIINSEDDLSMNSANVMEHIRFINLKYAGLALEDIESGVPLLYDSLGNTYWGNEGKAELLETLNKADNKNSLPALTDADTYHTEYTNGIGGNVIIDIHDYSE